MKILVKFRCQYKAKGKPPSRSLRLSDFVEESFKLDLDLKERVNVILSLQRQMDFDCLAHVLVERDKI